MRILFVTATYLPSINGVAIVVEETVKALRKLGHEVTILAPEHKEAEEDENIIRYPALPNPQKVDYPIPLLPVNLKSLKALKNKEFDIVHAQHPSYIFTMAEIIAKWNKCPTIFTYHTNYDLYLEIYFSKLPKRLNKMWVENSIERVAKKAETIIAPSKAIKAKVLNMTDKANVEVLTTGINPPEGIECNQKLLKKETELPIDKKLLLSISRLTKEKNLELCVHAIKHLDEETHLVIGGDGPAKEDLQELAKELGVENKVTFLGQVAHEDVFKYMGAADVFLVSSVTETQGLTAFEAAFMCTPIVAVESDVSREFFQNEGAIITENNVESFVKGINKMLQQDRKNMEIELKKWADNYTIEKYIENLLNIYTKAINK